MARVLKLKADIREKEVLRYLKFDPDRSKVDDKLGDLIKATIVAGKSKIKPRFAFRVLSITGNDGEKVSFKGFSLESRNVAKLLRRAVQAVIFTTSIGPGLEKEVSRLFKAGESTKAVILDAVGSEAVENITDSLQEQLAGMNGEYKATPRFSPGYGDWELKANKGILKLLDAQKIGVKVSSKHMLVPQKSVTGVWGLGRK
jgi:hypothetical protein